MVQDKAFAALRIVTGVIFLMHGLAKLQKGMDTIAAVFVDLGLPGWLAYLVLVIELIGGLALILGLAAIMAGAIVTV